MTLEQIKHAVRSGRPVYCGNKGYKVTRKQWPNGKEEFFIVYLPNGYTIGLTHMDGVTLNHNEDKFFIDWDDVELF